VVEGVVAVARAERHQVEGREGEFVARVAFDVLDVAEGEPGSSGEHVAMSLEEERSHDGRYQVAKQIFDGVRVLPRDSHGDDVLVVDFVHVLVQPFGVEHAVTHAENEVFHEHEEGEGAGVGDWIRQLFRVHHPWVRVVSKEDVDLGRGHKHKTVKEGQPDALPHELVPLFSICIPRPVAGDGLELLKEWDFEVIEEPEKQVTHGHCCPVDSLSIGPVPNSNGDPIILYVGLHERPVPLRHHRRIVEIAYGGHDTDYKADGTLLLITFLLLLNE